MVKSSLSLQKLPPQAQAAYAAARALWPDIDLCADDFLQHVKKLLRPDEDLATALVSLQLSELYLAFGCLQQVPGALAAFDKSYLQPAGESIQRIDPSPDFAAEVKQILRQKLLMANEHQQARIEHYAGRGPLLHFVRAALVRTALNHKRDRQRDKNISAAPLFENEVPALDPETLAIREDHRAAFQTALRTALGALPAQQRGALRLYLLEGLNIEHIGKVYQVHRATVARWLAQARATLAEQVRAELAHLLELPIEEVDQHIGLSPSKLDLSLSRLLRTDPIAL